MAATTWPFQMTTEGSALVWGATSRAKPTSDENFAQGNNIRLVDLHPGAWHDEIIVSLCQGSLSRELHYEALSYVWGSPVNPNAISLTDFRCQPVICTVTRNLDTALRRLRKQDTTRRLWIDALCIDQRDDEERAHQVSLMDQIYACAKQVVIYLGEVEVLNFSSALAKGRSAEANQSGEDFHFDDSDRPHLEYFRTRYSKAKMEERKGSSQRRKVQAFDVFCLIRFLAQGEDLVHAAPHDRNPQSGAQVESVAKYQRKVFEQLRQLLRSKWWSRVWVIQEAVVPERLSIMYSSCTAPWSMFTAAGLYFLRNESSAMMQDLPQDYRKVLAYFSRVVLDLHRLREDWSKGIKADIVSLLGQFSNRAASDDRDKIFALLGLANDGYLISPNYSLSVAETFQSVTLRMVDFSLSLDVLTGNVGTKNRMDLPSWTPDWSTSYDTMNSVWSQSSRLYNASLGLAVVLEDAKTRSPSLRMPKVFHDLRSKIASGVGIAPIHPCLDGALRVPGYQISTVTWVGEPYLSEEDRYSTIRSWWSAFPLESRASESVRDAFVRTLCADLFYTQSDNQERQPHRVNAADIQQLSSITSWCDAMLGLKTDMVPNTEVDLAIRLAATRRRFFLTGDCSVLQGSMGLGPLDMCVGDLIYILPGGRTPFILRKQELVQKPPDRKSFTVFDESRDIRVDTGYSKEARVQTYTIIGDCYVHGFMDGEAIESWKAAGSFPSCALEMSPLSQLPSFNAYEDNEPEEEPSLLPLETFRDWCEDLLTTKREIRCLNLVEGTTHKIPVEDFSKGYFNLAEHLSNVTGRYYINGVTDNELHRISVEIRSVVGDWRSALLEMEHLPVHEDDFWIRKQAKKLNELRKARSEREKELGMVSSAEERIVIKHHHTPDYLWAKYWGGTEWADRDHSGDIYIV